MPANLHPNTMRNSIAIAVGTVLFLLFMLLCYTRELSTSGGKPSMTLPSLLIGLGTCIAVIGVVEAGGHPPGERRFGMTVAVEGGLLVVLTLIAWWFMHPADPLYYQAVL